MNKLIVEGKNDEAFLKAYLKINFPNSIFDFIVLRNGLSSDSLKKALSELQRDFSKFTDTKLNLGLVLDVDDPDINNYENRFELSSKCLNEVFKSAIEIPEQNSIAEIHHEDITINCSIFLMSDSSGKGELMNLVKELKAKPSPKADCIYDCLKSGNENNLKEIDKDWIYHYIKWDNSTTKERKGGENLKFDILLNEGKKLDMWLFDEFDRFKDYIKKLLSN